MTCPMTLIWTEATLLDALHAFVQRNGHLPHERELGGKNGLPSYYTVHYMLGGLVTLTKLYLRHYQAPPTPDPPPVPSTRAGIVTCLRCDKPFLSPNKVTIRCHPNSTRCKPHDEDGAWLMGTPLPNDWWALYDEEDL